MHTHPHHFGSSSYACAVAIFAIELVLVCVCVCVCVPESSDMRACARVCANVRPLTRRAKMMVVSSRGRGDMGVSKGLARRHEQDRAEACMDT